MPRVTRAALRAHAALEESLPEASVPVPSTPRKERTPLGEIAGNVVEDSHTDIDRAQPTKTKKHGPSKARKKHGVREAKPKQFVQAEDVRGVLEDDNQSETSSAVEEACDNLKNDDNHSGLSQIILRDGDSDSPPSQAVNAIFSMEAPQNCSVALVDDKILPTQDNDEDSFLATIKLRTPARLTALENESVDPTRMEHSQPLDDSSHFQQHSTDDSFEDKIVMKSPAKTATRIEDSVEAIDAFEDEIDKIGELIPAISCPASHHREEPRINGATKPKNAAVTRKEAAAQRPSHPDKDGERRTAKTAPRATTTRLSSIHKPPFLPTKSTKPLTRSTFTLPGDAVAQKLKEQREERLKGDNAGVQRKAQVKTAPMAVKSNKPLTQPTFELPGDAIARKLKAKREQRLKQQEPDVGPQEKEIKARPVRMTRAPLIKESTTSKARMNLANGESTKINPSFRSGSIVRPASKRSASTALEDTCTRLTTISIMKRTSQTAAGASIHTVRRPSLAAAGSPQSSTQAAGRRLTSHGKPAHQTIRGREVFERSKTATEQTERLRKEKEDAAKKARAAAAERGRLASRQWAEKQRARKVSNEKCVKQEKAVAEA